MSVLENRYRRLLRSYPVDHRRVHEEEMLGGVPRRGWLARTGAGRRAVVVLAAPLYAIVAPFNPGYIEDPLARILITMVVIPVSIGVAALAVVTVLEWLVVRPLADRDRAVG
jgi:hypothetical protein